MTVGAGPLCGPAVFLARKNFGKVYDIRNVSGAVTMPHKSQNEMGFRRRANGAFLLIALLAGLIVSTAAYGDFEQALNALNTRSFEEKAVAAADIANSGHPRALAVLTALSEGSLFLLKSDRRIVIALPLESGKFEISDPVTTAVIGEVRKRKIRKLGLNNKLRRHLRGIIASLRIDQPDPDDRIAAIESIAEAGIPELRGILENRLHQESDQRVVRALEEAITIFDLDSDDHNIRLAAVKASSSNLGGLVRRKLTEIATQDTGDAELRAAAQVSLAEIERAVARYELIETLFFGLSLGSVLVLAAIGLSITFGMMGVINMAHGELIMLGAYTTYVVQLAMPNYIEWSIFVAIPAAFLVSGLTGVAIERGVIRFLYGRPLETLLATFGVSLILQQSVRSIFSPLNRAVATPEWMSGSIELVQGLSFTLNRLYILLFAALVFTALVLILQRTRLGLEVRAVTQNRAMARAIGIRSARVDVLTFGLGAGIAGVAGVALSQLTNVGPNLGQGYIVDSFMVVVFGGVGNLWGTLVAGLSLGVMNKILEPAVGAVVAKILILVFIILFIQKRPRGLFPQRGRAAQD